MRALRNIPESLGVIPGPAILVDKDNLFNDILKAYKSGVYNDISFIMADGSVISTNKFMLACRVPYFATFLSSGFAEGSADNKIHLKCCNSDIFKEILNFVWEGVIWFLHMNMQPLLEILETARFLCLDVLVEGVLEHLKGVILDGEMDFKDALLALNFTVENQFTDVSKIFLKFIDQNLSEISRVSEFQDLTETSLKMLLQYEDKVSSEIDRFKAFVKWIENKDDFAEDVKCEILGWFDLKKFHKRDLTGSVRKSNLYGDSALFDALELHVNILDSKIENLQVAMEFKEAHLGDLEDELVGQKKVNDKLIEGIYEKEYELDQVTKLHQLSMEGHEKAQKKLKKDHDDEIVAKNDLIEKQKEQISGCEKVEFRLLNENRWSGSMLIFEVPFKYQNHFVNKVDFVIGAGFDFEYSYILKCSQDKISWTKITQCNDENGVQVLHFERVKFKFLAIHVIGSKATGGRGKDVKPYISTVKAKMI